MGLALLRFSVTRHVSDSDFVIYDDKHSKEITLLTTDCQLLYCDSHVFAMKLTQCLYRLRQLDNFQANITDTLALVFGYNSYRHLTNLASAFEI